MMNADAIVEVLATLEKASVQVWLDGGWGVDALLGEQTREHTDYEPTEDDLRDMERLQQRFGVVLPVSLCRQ